jgi:hypothetical protein
MQYQVACRPNPASGPRRCGEIQADLNLSPMQATLCRTFFLLVGAGPWFWFSMVSA